MLNLLERRAAMEGSGTVHARGVLAKYARSVSSASLGAVTDKNRRNADRMRDESRSSKSGRAMACKANPTSRRPRSSSNSIRRLVAPACDAIEVASFVNPKRVPQMADCRSGDGRVAGSTGCAVRRPGAESSRLRSCAAAGCTEIGMVTAATDSFGSSNQGATIEDTIARGKRLRRSHMRPAFARR